MNRSPNALALTYKDAAVLVGQAGQAQARGAAGKIARQRGQQSRRVGAGRCHRPQPERNAPWIPWSATEKAHVSNAHSTPIARRRTTSVQ